MQKPNWEIYIYMYIYAYAYIHIQNIESCESINSPILAMPVALICFAIRKGYYMRCQQTNKQTSKQTSEQTNNKHKKQVNAQTNKQASEQTENDQAENSQRSK